jgi:hypothetical protein
MKGEGFLVMVVKWNVVESLIKTLVIFSILVLSFNLVSAYYSRLVSTSTGIWPCSVAVPITTVSFMDRMLYELATQLWIRTVEGAVLGVLIGIAFGQGLVLAKKCTRRAIPVCAVIGAALGSTLVPILQRGQMIILLDWFLNKSYVVEPNTMFILISSLRMNWVIIGLNHSYPQILTLMFAFATLHTIKPSLDRVTARNYRIAYLPKKPVF